MTAREPKAGKGVAFGEDADLPGGHAPKQGSGSDEAKGPGRRIGQSRGTIHAADLGDQDDHVANILFHGNGGEILKELISSNGLRSAWEKLVRRIMYLEDFCGFKKTRAAMSADELEQAFATRMECREIAIEQYEERLLKHERRLEALEAASASVLERFEVDEKDVSEIHNELTKHWDSIGVTQKDILRVEQQDLDHHEEARRLHDQQGSEMFKQRSASEEANTSLGLNLEAEKAYRLDLRQMVQELRDFLYSAGLQKQLETIAGDMLVQYVSWDEMKVQEEQIHTKAVGAATVPLEQLIETLRHEMSVSNAKLTSEDAALSKNILSLGGTVDVVKRRFLDRVDEVLEQVNLRAMDSRLSEVEKYMTDRAEFHELDFRDFKEAQTKKIEDSYDRVQELESNIFAHEHALEHWAEEIANRSTKYDTMVIAAALEKCALKERTDADYKEVQKILKWQTVKIESLSFKNSFGGASNAGSEASAPVRKPAPSSAGGKRQAARISAQSSVTVRSTPSQSGKPSPVPMEVQDDDNVSVSSRTGKTTDPKRLSIVSGDDTAVNGLEAQQIGDAGEASNHLSMASLPEWASEEAAEASPTEESHSAAPAHYHASEAAEASHSAAPHSAAPADYHAPAEMMAVTQQQLENLGQCILCLSHLTLRPAVCGLSRDARIEQEDRIIFHVGSLLYWIVHRAPPPDWDPMELQSLALSCAGSNSEQKAHARHGSQLHHSSYHSSGHHSSNHSSRRQLTKSDTWGSDHMLTSRHPHVGHLPKELTETARRRLTADSSEDPSPASSYRQLPIAHAHQRTHLSARERENCKWRERANKNASGIRPMRIQKAKTGSVGLEGDAAVYGREGMNQTMGSDLFGDDDQNSDLASTTLQGVAAKRSLHHQIHPSPCPGEARSPDDLAARKDSNPASEQGHLPQLSSMRGSQSAR